MFTEDDLIQLEKKGISQDQVYHQIEQFKNGFPFARLKNAATIDNGIVRFAEEEIDGYVSLFKELSLKKEITKFVPASGAATRMFKSLFEFRNEIQSDDVNAELLINENKYSDVKEFFEQIEKFAFYKQLKQIASEKDIDIEQLTRQNEFGKLLDLFLSDEGLNYAMLPKALLRFHRYVDRSRLAIEEHLVEGVQYAKDKDNIVRIHFTVSPEHEKAFLEQLKNLIPHYEQAFEVEFMISFSQQKSSTDTIAVDLENNPFRDKDGSLVFRPAGHGALIQNLNDLLADIVFIKNIDNIVPDHLRAQTVRYKQLIGGYLFYLQSKTNGYLQQLENNDYDTVILKEIEDFAFLKLNIEFEDDYYSKSDKEKAAMIFNYLYRPIRVCGMVKNEGEPGGGPYWLEDGNRASLQIVESSQINLKSEQQFEIFKSATHFNPVDLVCALKDFNGENFNLLEFTDPQTGFISEKSKDGKILKAMEMPGLWNGAMANWITIFVEVPIITFNPVKTINDLLRSQHQ